MIVLAIEEQVRGHDGLAHLNNRQNHYKKSPDFRTIPVMASKNPYM